MNIYKRSLILPIVLCLTVLFLCSNLAYSAPEQENARLEIFSLPLNPSFEEYLELMDKGDLELFTEEGYPLGYIPPPVERYRDKAHDDITLLEQPEAFDLRNEDRVTPVKDQDPYGSCWAFATYSSLESYLLPGSENNFSENNLMRLHGFDWGPNDGGNEFISMAYLSRWSGPVKEADDPYPTNPANSNLSPVRHVQKVEFVPETTAHVKQALYDNGALFTAMYWLDDYFNDATNSYYYLGNSKPNHGVAIVGWDDNYDKNNFDDPKPIDDGAWIIKNSWGAGWGDGGYFYMSYEDYYAMADATAFHNAESTDNYDHTYYYDFFGITNMIGFGSETAYGSNIFTAGASEYLTAVSFFTFVHDTSYEIEIYTGVDAGNPISGSRKHVQNGTVVYGGYHTVPLEKDIFLAQGELFSVVIKFTTPEFVLPIPIEDAVEGFSSNATINPGQSFLSFDGSNWEDFYNIAQELEKSWKNITIRAFTERESPDYYNLIYFQNIETGYVDTWAVEGFNITEHYSGIYGMDPSRWRIAAVYDVSKNGSPDLIWENINTGARRAWVMNGLEKVLEVPVGPGVVNSRFRIADLHDMDGDGNLDVIWQNIVFGGRNVWFMDGFERVGGRQFTVANTNWNIVGVEDMGDDGKTNIIWEHVRRGERNYWTLDENLNRIDGESGNFYQTGINWNIRAVQDITYDGNPDILFEHSEDGRRNMWIMDGMDITEGGNIGTRPPEWTIVGAARVTESFDPGVPATPIQINVSASPPEGGVIEGGGTFTLGDKVTLTATANSGWSFVRWEENGSSVSTNQSYSFTAKYNRNLIAVFETINGTGNIKDGTWFGMDMDEPPRGWLLLNVNNDQITAQNSDIIVNNEQASIYIEFNYSSNPVAFYYAGDVPIDSEGLFEISLVAGPHNISIFGAFFETHDPSLPDQAMIGYAFHDEPGRSMDYMWIGFNEADLLSVESLDKTLYENINTLGDSETVKLEAVMIEQAE